MIAVEDADNNLLPAINRAARLEGRRIFDLGSGTGRLPLLVSSLARQIVSLDLQRAMLREQLRQRAQVGGNWPLLQADMRVLPVASGWADVTIAGWAIGHLVGWHPDDWQVQTGRVLAEMQRVTAPAGTLIILETLSTGSLVPRPPSEGLARYYAWLEGEWGFTRQEIRTDYQFASADQAAQWTRFFFGEALAAEIVQRGWARLPEWTGVWSRPAAGRG